MSPQACLFEMLFCFDKSTFPFCPPHLTVHSCHVIALDLLMSHALCLITYSSDGVWGTPCDPLPLWKRLQWWPSPSVAAAAPGKNPPQEQEAQSTPGAGGHPQAKGSGERKTPCPHTYTDKLTGFIFQISHPLNGLPDSSSISSV